MTTLYDSLQTEQALTLLDDITFAAATVMSPGFTEVQIPLTPPVGFVNPLVATNQGAGSQLFVMLRNFSACIERSAALGSGTALIAMSDPRYPASQLFMSASIPGMAVNNVQTFTVTADANMTTATMNSLDSIFFSGNANLTVNEIDAKPHNAANYLNLGESASIPANTFFVISNQFGNKGMFTPYMNDGFDIRVTVSNSSAAAQTYTMIAFGYIDMTIHLVLLVRYIDINGTYHHIGILDNRQPVNLAINNIIQAPIAASALTYGSLDILAINTNNTYPLGLNLAYALTMSFVYMQPAT